MLPAHCPYDPEEGRVAFCDPPGASPLMRSFLGLSEEGDGLRKYLRGGALGRLCGLFCAERVNDACDVSRYLRQVE